MKKVMHGDRIIATLHTDKDREIAEPETLVEPFYPALLAGCNEKMIVCLSCPTTLYYVMLFNAAQYVN